MSMNKVKLSQIINDFIITSDGDDYVSSVSDSAIRNFALRGIRLALLGMMEWFMFSTKTNILITLGK